MNDNRRQRHKIIILATAGVLLMLVALCWGFMSWMSWREEQLAWREEQLATRPTTPELVLQAFRDANYQIDDIQVGQGRRDLHPLFDSPERYINFKARGGSQSDFTHVSIVQYGSREEAEKAAGYINYYNEKWNGFLYAYHRDTILMAVDTKSDRIAGELKGVFQSAAEP